MNVSTYPGNRCTAEAVVAPTSFASRGVRRTVWSRLGRPMILGAAVFLVLAVTGCRSSRRQEAPLAARFYLEAAAAELSTPVVLPRSGVRVMVGPKPVLSEYDVANVEIAEVDLGRCLAFEFTPAAAGALARMSSAYPGRRLVFVLEGEPIGVRPIDETLLGGRLLIFVERADADLPRLAARLKRSAEVLAPDVTNRS